MNNRQLYLSLAIGTFFVLTIFLRSADNLPNFASVTALALFSGAVLRSRTWSFLLPLGCVLIGDAIFEWSRPGSGFYAGNTFVYASYLLVILLGFLLREKRNVIRVAGLSLAASAVFFLVSNFGVWFSTGMYERTFSGLINCYVMALPFVKYSLVSDLAFSALFFGIFSVAVRREPIAA